MQALKKIVDVRNRQITLELPEDFCFEQVEVTISPYMPANMKKVQKKEYEWKKDFLSISKWDNDLEEVRVSSWIIEK